MFKKKNIKKPQKFIYYYFAMKIKKKEKIIFVLYL